MIEFLKNLFALLFKAPSSKEPETVAPAPTPSPPPLPEGYLSPHFKLSEFTRSSTAQANDIANTPGPEHLANLKVLAQTLEQVRVILGNHPILISSGYRSKTLNALVGGSQTSDHANGLAVDFACPKFGTVKQVCEALAGSGLAFDQIIYEQGNTRWIHLGIGERMRRQTLSWSSKTGYVSGIKDLA